MNKRQTALAYIRIEVAMHGKVTAAATRKYIENRISRAAYNEAVYKGYAQYEATHAELNQGVSS